MMTTVRLVAMALIVLLCGPQARAGDAPPATQPAPTELSIVVQQGANPWSHLDIVEDPSTFSFAILPDVNGGEREGILADAVAKLNLLRPKFVIGIGDYIPGHKQDQNRLDAQWEKFFRNIAPLRPPILYTPGGHDIVGPLMRRTYERHFGRSWFWFTYRDVLFLVLDSQHPENGQISPEQIAMTRQALAENPSPRWTFVFIHRPLWEENTDNRFDQVEQLLQGRPYSVFAGHIHRYLKCERFGRDYYVLGTAGGANAFRGPDFGEIDHLTWVTMTSDGPVIANLELGGIHRDDLRTTATADIAHHTQHTFEKQSLRLDGSAFDTPRCFELKLKNGAKIPVRLAARFEPHPFLQVQPRVLDLTLAPGSGQGTGGSGDPSPLPPVVPLRLTPLRAGSAEDLPPLKLVGTLRYHCDGGRGVSIPVEHSIPIDREWPLERGSVALDGKPDEWPELRHSTALPREVIGNADGWSGPADGQVAFDVRYDETNLYVALRVSDDALLPEAGGAGDGVDLWLDARADEQRVVPHGWQNSIFVQFHRITLVPAADGSVIVRDADKLPRGTRAVASKSADGWTAEVMVPLGYVRSVQGDSWGSVRLNVVLNDADAPGESPATIGWMPDWRWKRNIPGSGTFVRAREEPRELVR